MKKKLKKVSWIFLFCEKYVFKNACCHISLAIEQNCFMDIVSNFEMTSDSVIGGRSLS